MRSLVRSYAFIVALLAGAIAPCASSAQPGTENAQPFVREYGVFVADQDLRRDARLLATNAALGAATAGLVRWMSGKPVLPGLAGGAAGGALAYAGKRIVVERWEGAGLVGRQVASVGHSIVRNAAEERALLARLILPLGPLRLYLRPDSATRLRARIDAPTAIYAVLLAANGNPLDARASLSSGALVFRVPDDPLSDLRGRCIPGLAFGGAIVLSDLTGLATDDRNPTFAHERVHVVQYDQLYATVGDPAEEWIGRRVGWFGRVKRWADFNATGLVAMVPQAVFNEWTPWEAEALAVTRQAFGNAPLPDAQTSHLGCSAS